MSYLLLVIFMVVAVITVMRMDKKIKFYLSRPLPRKK